MIKVALHPRKTIDAGRLFMLIRRSTLKPIGLARMKFGILVLNYNGRRTLKKCIESLVNVEYPKHLMTIYVIDNGSDDNSLEEVGTVLSEKIRGPQIKLSRNSVNYGFSVGNNLGMISALRDGCEAVVLINNDAYAHPEMLNIYERELSNEKVGILSGRVDYYGAKQLWYPHPIWKLPIGIREATPDKRIQLVEAVTACCMCVRAEVLEAVGFFDPAFGTYYEDSDLCVRASRRGFQVKHIPQTVCYHDTVGFYLPKSSSFAYFYFRNRAFFMRKNFRSYRYLFPLDYLAIAPVLVYVAWYMIAFSVQQRALFNRFLRGIRDSFLLLTSSRYRDSLHRVNLAFFEHNH